MPAPNVARVDRRLIVSAAAATNLYVIAAHQHQPPHLRLHLSASHMGAALALLVPPSKPPAPAEQLAITPPPPTAIATRSTAISKTANAKTALSPAVH